MTFLKQQITKGAIEASFLRLLRVKPFEKITVRDIVEDCGLTRNTFYYYYQDIYDIVEDVFHRLINETIASAETADNWEEILDRAVDTLRGNKKMVHNLFLTSKSSELTAYLSKSIARLISHYLEPIPDISESDKVLLVRFCTNAFKGMFRDWIESGMEGDFAADIKRTIKLFIISMTDAARKTHDSV